MVCLRGERLTPHMNQMKLFNAITAAAVIATSAISLTPMNAKSAPYCSGRNGANHFMVLWEGGAPYNYALKKAMAKYHDGSIDCNYEWNGYFKHDGYPIPFG